LRVLRIAIDDQVSPSSKHASLLVDHLAPNLKHPRLIRSPGDARNLYDRSAMPITNST
jgi:hypothetical protein